MWKVGQLAKRTGISVRTLHHYDEIGLLTPSHRTESGHRLYDESDVARLQQIVSLRQLGFALDAIGDLLRRPGTSLVSVLDLHLAHLRGQIELQRKLCMRMERIASRLRAAEEVSTNDILTAIEETIMFEKYFTPDQMETLKQRADALGPARMQAAQEEWPKLMEEVRAEMERGTDPKSPRVQELAKRWNALIREFSGGDPAIESSVTKMYHTEPGAAEKYGVDLRLFDYIRKATA
jgi:DNA-binding transcriptional MerR regulator